MGVNRESTLFTPFFTFVIPRPFVPSTDKTVRHISTMEVIVTTKTDIQEIVRLAIREELAKAQFTAPMPTDTPQYFDLKTAADYLGCAPTTIYAYQKQGLRSIKKGGLKFTKDWLDEFMQQNKRRTTTDLEAEANDRLMQLRNRPKGHKKGGRA
jgi:hypothetical protein